VDRVQDRYGNTIYRHDQRACRGLRRPGAGEGRAPDIESNRSRIMNR
jgi:penicillin-binding protein 1A